MGRRGTDSLKRAGIFRLRAGPGRSESGTQRCAPFSFECDPGDNGNDNRPLATTVRRAEWDTASIMMSVRRCRPGTPLPRRNLFIRASRCPQQNIPCCHEQHARQSQAMRVHIAISGYPGLCPAIFLQHIIRSSVVLESKRGSAGEAASGYDDIACF
jgi:hypothetical protein